MEHEVFVPVPAERLREALADPTRVAGAVPGLQQEAGAEPVTGRLRIRVGSHSVTYRGTVQFSARDDGTYAAEGEAVEARGTGTVALALTVRVAGAGGGVDGGAGHGAGAGADAGRGAGGGAGGDAGSGAGGDAGSGAGRGAGSGAGRGAGGGATLTFAGTASVSGRLAALPQDAVTAAVTRLLTRFGENLGRAALSGPETEVPPPSPGPGRAGEGEHVTEQQVTAEPSAADEPLTAEPPAADEPLTGEPPVADEPLTAELPADPLPEPPAEAAHARRTMIGRSAEEVDHAPPRGRYAPVPAPQAAASGTPLRWAAPAAALVVASAIVVGRALRRRR